MTRRVRVLAAILALLASACGPPQAPAAVTADTADGSSWRMLGTWSGRGNRQTESFDVVTGALRLRWETLNETTPGAGRLRVTLHSAISGRPLQTIVEHDGIGSATAALADEPRTSYLVIDAADVDWRITLEEGVARATPRTPATK